ncbi:MAG TPA: ATP-dependent zinc metalloprotease FtsH [Verrucomicrobiae bacterium]|nr:ATP-dependent zinc metalloprotease FtsH [Verrucomicrobiae bacterium]
MDEREQPELEQMEQETPPRRPVRRPSKGRGGMPMPPQPGCSRNFAWIVLALIAFAVLSYAYNPNRTEPETLGISDVANKVQNGEVKKIVVENDTDLTVTLSDGKEVKSSLRQNDTLKDYDITRDKTEIEIKFDATGTIWLVLLQTLLPALIIVGLIIYMFRATAGQNMKAMSFGQSRAKLANMSKVRFKDVAGLKEAKTELEEEVEFLRSPGRFKALGAEIPKGVLLIGPPGTGKTLLAKAVAGEAGVPFFTISASEFVEMFVGVGASRVRDLFAKAKRMSPCIIFIDELDAIGRQRGTGLGGGHDEREQTLNQILVEMDGFETDAGVIVMAATNRPDVLDPALLRPGRFDRRVVVDLPTRDERIEVLKVYADKKPLAKGINLDAIANQTAGLSPADLKNVMNEAAILSARRDQKEITQPILHEAVEKILVGPERPSRVLSDSEKRITAVHEAGHAIVGHVLPLTDDIHKVSIISRGMALGLTWSLPREDKHLISEAKFKDELAMLLGGRLAEMLVFKEPTTGASNDLKRATDMARRMITVFGMSEKLGLRTYGEQSHETFLGRSMGEQRDYSEERAKIIDEEIFRIIDEAEKKASSVLTKYRKALDHLADLLIEKETVSGEELTAILESDTGVSKPESPLA